MKTRVKTRGEHVVIERVTEAFQSCQSNHERVEMTEDIAVLSPEQARDLSDDLRNASYSTDPEGSDE